MPVITPTQTAAGSAGGSGQGTSGLAHPMLAALRGDAARRPVVDPGLAGGLREWLEDGVSEAARTLERRGQVLVRVSTPRHAGEQAWTRPPGGPQGPGALRALLTALFRQWVTSGAMGDPATDALAALRADGRYRRTVERVDGLAAGDRLWLEEQLRSRAAVLRARWPVLPPAWLPRTSERITIPLAGGRVELTGVVDLLVGAPPSDRSSACVVLVATGPSSSSDREASRFLALLETLRSGAKPCRVAVYDAVSGEADVTDVTDAALGAGVRHAIDLVRRACDRLGRNDRQP